MPNRTSKMPTSKQRLARRSCCVVLHDTKDGGQSMQGFDVQSDSISCWKSDSGAQMLHVFAFSAYATFRSNPTPLANLTYSSCSSKTTLSLDSTAGNSQRCVSLNRSPVRWSSSTPSVHRQQSSLVCRAAAVFWLTEEHCRKSSGSRDCQRKPEALTPALP